MANYIGIDIGGERVRAVLLRSSYRKLAVEGFGECELASVESLPEAIRLATSELVKQGDSVAIGLEGEKLFVRSLNLPPTALKQLAEVLPFELEANLPVELDEIIYDHALLRRPDSDGPLDVLAVAARTDDIRERIELVTETLAVEAQMVGAGAFALGALVAISPDLVRDEPIGVLDVGELRSELAILEHGEVVFARTIGRGIQGTADAPALLLREIRQSISAFRAAGGAEISRIHLAGAGASSLASGEEPSPLQAFFQAELGIEIADLPPMQLEPMPAERAASLPRFVKALALALSMLPRQKVMNLRRGPLAYERGYAFLRDKIPVLSGLSVVIIASFFFSAWAEMRGLDHERDTLQEALAKLSQEVLGEETRDPDRAMSLLSRGPGSADEDPMPYVDAFDVMVQLSKTVPEDIEHDVEELDVQRGKVTIHGIVPTIPDAQEVASGLRNYRCFQDVKIVRTNQVVGDNRQKYVLELDIKCPVEKKDDKKSDSEGAKP